MNAYLILRKYGKGKGEKERSGNEEEREKVAEDE